MRPFPTFLVKSCLPILLLFVFFITNSFAQCPASLNDSALASPATCQSNGVITIIGSVGDTAVSYQILSGPAGYSAVAQTNNVFSNLLPGTYSVKAFCNSLSDTIYNIVIASQYTFMTITPVTSNVCTSNTPGGTITTTVTGGKPPYQYSYFTGNANAPDSTLTYVASNTYTTSLFGTYNIRVKDACGNIKTQQSTIARTYPSNLCISSGFSTYGNLTCAQLADSVDLNFTLSANTKLNSLPSQGITINLYQNNGTCASPSQGALIKTQHFNPSDTNLIVIPKKNVLLTLVTPCGDSCTYCYTYSASSLLVTASLLQNGCATASNPNGTLGMSASVNSNFVYPLTYTLKNSAGTIIETKTYSSGSTAYSYNNLPYDTYTVTVTDICGHISTATVNPPATTGTQAALRDSVVTSIGSCTSQNGRVALSVYLFGYMPNLSNATVTIIAPSPTNVGSNGVVFNGNRWDWSNVLPGETYYIKVNNNCGVIDTLQINTPAGTGQNQSINTNVTQLCGGGGNINVTISRLGTSSVSFVLKNSSGTTVGTGILSGSFPNLPADTYSVIATVSGGCTYTFSKTGIVILPSGSGPAIIKKLGIVCEDANGVQLTTGMAMVEVIGAKPLTAEYKLTSDSVYSPFTLDSTGTGVISGLTAYQSYSIRITDACGNSTITEISIGKLNVLKTENNAEPCVGKNYALSVPDMIDATYQWKKNGAVISNAREIDFSPYTSSDDGTYECTVVIGGGCVIRVSNFTLSSTKCGQLITVNLSGNVFDDGNGLNDNTVNGTGIGSASSTQLYANLLDANGNVIASVPVNNNGSYTFTNLTPGNDVIQLTTIPGTVGNPAPATQLPSGWVNTGENIGTGPGNDGNINGLLPVTIGQADVTNADFGIDKIPAADNITTPIQLNPGGTTTVPVPVLTGNDNEDGSYNGGNGNTIIIDSLPSNGILYYNGNPVTSNDTIPNYNPSLLTLDPSDTATIVIFTYSEVDSAGIASPPATVTMPFNNLPTANTDYTATPVNTPVTVPVLVNDDFGGDGPSTGTITIIDQPHNGTAAVDDGGTSNNPKDDMITYTPDPNYSGNDTLIYEICDSNGDCDTAMVIITITKILPVKLIDFSANLKDNMVNLIWNTEQETSVKDYEILFSTNGADFTSIGKVTAMNSGNYTYIHSSPVTGNNYYRIKTNDKNGTSSYSEVKEVSLNKNMSISVFPNPAHNIVTVSFNKPSVENQALKLVNITGQIVYEQAVSIGTQAIRLDVSKFSKNSTYILKLTGSKSVEIQKIVIE